MHILITPSNLIKERVNNSSRFIIIDEAHGLEYDIFIFITTQQEVLR